MVRIVKLPRSLFVVAARFVVLVVLIVLVLVVIIVLVMIVWFETARLVSENSGSESLVFLLQFGVGLRVSRRHKPEQKWGTNAGQSFTHLNCLFLN